MKPILILALALTTVLGVASGGRAAQIQTSPDPNLVYVHGTAMNRDGRFVSQIPRQFLKISEDGAEQEILYFSEGKFPVRAAVVLDAGNSIKDQLKSIVTSVFRKNSPPTDELHFVDPGNTPVNDAVLKAISDLVKPGDNKKLVLILLSLNNDPGEYSFSKVKDALKENNVLFYTTAVPSRPEKPYGLGTRNLLEELTELGGGTSFFPSTSSQLEGIYQNIALDLQRQYVIGYRPKKAADGKWRKFRVTAEITDGRKTTRIDLRTREGYYARPASAHSK